MDYTIETLKKENYLYNKEHGINNSDVQKVNKLKALIEKQLECSFKAGVIVRCIGEEKTYENAHLDDINYLGEFGTHTCMNASVHTGFSDNAEGFFFSCSGGYFVSEKDTGKFKFTGKTRLKRFWTWGHCGACGGGGICFEAKVGVWEYKSEKIY